MSANQINFAAIDIGSNAARLLIASVNPNNLQALPVKVILLRYPLRLGEDVFSKGEISKERVEKTVQLIKSYKHLMRLYDVVTFRAYATSAMREAKNGNDVVALIKVKTGIDIEIINGETEANIIYESHIADMLNHDSNYIYVDVGGGSTEVTLISKGQFLESKSFNIGTLRMLANGVKPDAFTKLSQWVAKLARSYPQLEIIGSGGNINKLYRIAKLNDGDKLPTKKLQELYNSLASYTLDERINKLKMRPDRADVIIPASEIFLTVAKAGDIEYINVPTIGLADGIVNLLHTEYCKSLNIPR